MRTWLLMALAAILLLFAADPCFAAHEGGGGGEKGMFDRALDLGIWTLLVFLILLFILSRYAWKPMLEGLTKREHDIAAAVEESKKAREEAAALRQQVADDRQRANDEARSLIDEARKAAEQLAVDRKVRADADIAQDRERLRREITVAKDQALKEMWSQAAQLATVVASKIVRRQLNPDDQRVLVDEALSEMNAAMDQRQRVNGTGTSA